MNTGVKVLIGFIVAGAVGTGIYFAVRKKKGGVDSLGGGDGSNEPYKDNTAMGVKDTIPSSVFPLKHGSQGRNVLLLQQALGNVDVDGSFGGQTATKAKLACFSSYPLGTGVYGACEVSQSDVNNIINKAGGLAKVQQAVMATKSAIWNRYS